MKIVTYLGSLMLLSACGTSSQSPALQQLTSSKGDTKNSKILSSMNILQALPLPVNTFIVR